MNTHQHASAVPAPPPLPPPSPPPSSRLSSSIDDDSREDDAALLWACQEGAETDVFGEAYEEEEETSCYHHHHHHRRDVDDHEEDGGESTTTTTTSSRTNKHFHDDDDVHRENQTTSTPTTTTTTTTTTSATAGDGVGSANADNNAGGTAGDLHTSMKKSNKKKSSGGKKGRLSSSSPHHQNHHRKTHHHQHQQQQQHVVVSTTTIRRRVITTSASADTNNNDANYNYKHDTRHNAKHTSRQQRQQQQQVNGGGGVTGMMNTDRARLLDDKRGNGESRGDEEWEGSRSRAATRGHAHWQPHLQKEDNEAKKPSWWRSPTGGWWCCIGGSRGAKNNKGEKGIKTGSDSDDDVKRRDFSDPFPNIKDENDDASQSSSFFASCFCRRRPQLSAATVSGMLVAACAFIVAGCVLAVTLAFSLQGARELAQTTAQSMVDRTSDNVYAFLRAPEQAADAMQYTCLTDTSATAPTTVRPSDYPTYNFSYFNTPVRVTVVAGGGASGSSGNDSSTFDIGTGAPTPIAESPESWHFGWWQALSGMLRQATFSFTEASMIFDDGATALCRDSEVQTDAYVCRALTTSLPPPPSPLALKGMVTPPPIPLKRLQTVTFLRENRSIVRPIPMPFATSSELRGSSQYLLATSSTAKKMWLPLSVSDFLPPLSSSSSTAAAVEGTGGGSSTSRKDLSPTVTLLTAITNRTNTLLGALSLIYSLRDLDLALKRMVRPTAHSHAVVLSVPTEAGMTSSSSAAVIVASSLSDGEAASVTSVNVPSTHTLSTDDAVRRRCRLIPYPTDFYSMIKRCPQWVAEFPYAPLQALHRDHADVLYSSSSSSSQSSSSSSSSVTIGEPRMLALAGSNYFVVVLALATPNVAGMNWRVALFMPEDEVIGEIVRGRNIAIGASIALAIFFAASAALLMRKVLSPIAGIADRMQRAVFFRIRGGGGGTTQTAGGGEKQQQNKGGADTCQTTDTADGDSTRDGTRRTTSRAALAQLADEALMTERRPSYLSEVASIQSAYWMMADEMWLLKGYVPHYVLDGLYARGKALAKAAAAGNRGLAPGSHPHGGAQSHTRSTGRRHRSTMAAVEEADHGEEMEMMTGPRTNPFFTGGGGDRRRMRADEEEDAPRHEARERDVAENGGGGGGLSVSVPCLTTTTGGGTLPLTAQNLRRFRLVAEKRKPLLQNTTPYDSMHEEEEAGIENGAESANNHDHALGGGGSEAVRNATDDCRPALAADATMMTTAAATPHALTNGTHPTTTATATATATASTSPLPAHAAPHHPHPIALPCEMDVGDNPAPTVASTSRTEHGSDDDEHQGRQSRMKRRTTTTIVDARATAAAAGAGSTATLALTPTSSMLPHTQTGTDTAVVVIDDGRGDREPDNDEKHHHHQRHSHAHRRAGKVTVPSSPEDQSHFPTRSKPLDDISSSAPAAPLYFRDHSLIDREITMVVINIVDFHSYVLQAARRDVQAIAREFPEFLKLVEHYTEAYHGVLETFSGDKFIVSFNATALCPDHVQHAVAFACTLSAFATRVAIERQKYEQERAAANTSRGAAAKHQQHRASSTKDPYARWARSLRLLARGITCGVATGKCIAGPLGSDSVKRHTIISNALVEAAALERLCMRYPGCAVLVGGDVIPHISRDFEYLLLDAMALPGSGGKRRHVASVKYRKTSAVVAELAALQAEHARNVQLFQQYQKEYANSGNNNNSDRKKSRRATDAAAAGGVQSTRRRRAEEERAGGATPAPYAQDEAAESTSDVTMVHAHARDRRRDHDVSTTTTTTTTTVAAGAAGFHLNTNGDTSTAATSPPPSTIPTRAAAKRVSTEASSGSGASAIVAAANPDYHHHAQSSENPPAHSHCPSASVVATAPASLPVPPPPRPPHERSAFQQLLLRDPFGFLNRCFIDFLEGRIQTPSSTSSSTATAAASTQPMPQQPSSFALNGAQLAMLEMLLQKASTDRHQHEQARMWRAFQRYHHPGAASLQLAGNGGGTAGGGAGAGLEDNRHHHNAWLGDWEQHEYQQQQHQQAFATNHYSSSNGGRYGSPATATMLSEEQCADILLMGPFIHALLSKGPEEGLRYASAVGELFKPQHHLFTLLPITPAASVVSGWHMSRAGTVTNATSGGGGLLEVVA